MTFHTQGRHPSTDERKITHTSHIIIVTEPTLIHGIVVLYRCSFEDCYSASRLPCFHLLFFYFSCSQPSRELAQQVCNVK